MPLNRIKNASLESLENGGEDKIKIRKCWCISKGGESEE
jgi:hypothetical protein